MREKPVTVSTPCISLLVVVLILLCLVPFSSSSLRSANAAVTTAISPTGGTGSPASLGTIITSGTSTVPSPLCTASCVITGGTRAGNNLFHSFGDFNIGALDSARFQTGLVHPLPDASVSNILARVTGGPSNLFGNLDSATYYPSANLFLMNPAGFLFGPNATVNVGGMMTFTTADYLKLTDNVRFNAIPDLVADALLTAAPVAAFGFIGSNPQAITFDGGQLTVASGTGITLVGGDINLVPDLSGTPSGITAPGRQIRLTSVAGAGEVATDTEAPAPGMTLGTITLGQGTVLDTRGDLSLGGDGRGGAISIRGGQFVATGATIITSPAALSTGSGGDVTVSVTGSASFTDNTFIQTADGLQQDGVTTLNAGPAGALSISANDSLTMTNTIIDTSTASATGNSGPVTLTTNGPLSLTDSFIYTVSSGSGNGGAVTIAGKDVTFTRDGIFTDVDTGNFDLTTTPAAGQVHPGAVTVTAENTVTFSGSFSDDPGIPVISAIALGTLADAGSVTINGKTVNLSNGTIVVSMNEGQIPSPGNGGAIEIHGNNVNLSHFSLQSLNAGLIASTGKGGSVLLQGADNPLADNIQLTDSFVSTASASGGGGGTVEFQTKALTLSDHTIVLTSAFGLGSGGIITVSGAENVTIESGSNITSEVLFPGAGIIPHQGAAGNILLETQNLTIRGGGRITATADTNSLGNAGNITVQGTHGSAQSVLIDGAGSGIFTDTQGTGAGGNIDIASQSLTLQNGGALSAATSGTTATATGGTITVNANQVQLNNGGLITASTTRAGAGGSITIDAGTTFASNASTVSSTAAQAQGGNINITAGQSVTLNNRSLITAKSEGPGNAGNILINAGQNYTSTDSAVTTQATATGTEASGGNITVLATDTVQLTNNSQLNASVQGSSTTVGGNITIDPQYVILQNSQILAQATQGQGGAISINITNGGLFLPDANSVISASSQFGTNGTVTIQSPNAPISGQIQPLGKTPLLATSLLNQHCAALAGGEFSSFTLAGRDSLPTEPGGWLASPLVLAQAEFSAGAVAEAGAQARVIDPAQETTVLSLRQIAPAGFLTQTFAVDWSASCQS